MQIVIDIPAEDFEKVKCGRGAVSMMRKAIIHGTPLPEGAEILTKEAYSDLCTMAADVPDTNPNLQPICNQLATDCISRQAVLLRLNEFKTNDTYTMQLFENELKHLPSVEPERKMGKIICSNKEINCGNIIGHTLCCKCSECGFVIDTYIAKFIKYCPNCGAKMEVDG